jgi:PHS family inorganic phosphate transporter-like MFS transporter
MSVSLETLKKLDESKLSAFHFKMVFTAGMGFFTDAYDLFIIGVVSYILRDLWHLNTVEVSLLSSTSLISAAVGAVIFGRIADCMGRKFVYGYELLVLAAGAIASAFAPGIVWLIIFRCVLGLGIGGDYPVSSTLMSEYANRRDRGKLVTLVFSTQALGLIIGPLLTVVLLLSNVNSDITWRILLGFGALPALTTFWSRRQIAESPRFALAQGGHTVFTQSMNRITGVKEQLPAKSSLAQCLMPQRMTIDGEPSSRQHHWTALFKTRHLLLWLIGAASTWFLLDFAYYGTTVSTPIVIKLFSPNSSLVNTMLYTLLIFVIAALPGYIVAALLIDRIGRKTIQLLGFAMMAIAYGALFIFPVLTQVTAPFLLAYGLAYFFTEFGPNVTTFVYPAEIFPVTVRTTAHGFAAATGKVGAFSGAFIFPILLTSANFKLPGALGIAGGVCVIGFFLTFLLPEPNQKSLEDIEREGESEDEQVGHPDDTMTKEYVSGVKTETR